MIDTKNLSSINQFFLLQLCYNSTGHILRKKCQWSAKFFVKTRISKTPNTTVTNAWIQYMQTNWHYSYLYPPRIAHPKPNHPKNQLAMPIRLTTPTCPIHYSPCIEKCVSSKIKAEDFALSQFSHSDCDCLSEWHQAWRIYLISFSDRSERRTMYCCLFFRKKINNCLPVFVIHRGNVSLWKIMVLSIQK